MVMDGRQNPNPIVHAPLKTSEQLHSIAWPYRGVHCDYKVSFQLKCSQSETGRFNTGFHLS